MVEAIRDQVTATAEVLRWAEVDVSPVRSEVRPRQTAVGLNFIDTGAATRG